MWHLAKIIFGAKMACDPAQLVLGYINPFKPRATGKPVPSSLENEDEWTRLVQHVRVYKTNQVAKYQGKGGTPKDFCITLVNLTQGQAKSKV